MGQDGNREYIHPPALNTESDKTNKTMALKTLDNRKKWAVILRDRNQIR